MTEPAGPGGTTTLPSEATVIPEVPAAPARNVPGLLLAGYALLLAVAWSNEVFNWAVIPKAALDLCVIGPGLVALVWLLARRDAPAIAAAAFLVLASLATLLADEPMMSLVGEYFSLNGLIFVGVCVAAWALGRVTLGSTSVVGLAILAGAAINAAVAWLQVSTDLGIPGLGPFEGRAQGLMGNPVFLGALCAGALWIALDRERDAERPIVLLALTGFLVGAVNLSGSRIAVAAALGAILWFTIAHVRRSQRLRAVVLLAVAGVGFGLSQLPHAVASSTAERVGAHASSGFGPRLRLWQGALEGVADRPWVGYGPGRSATATTSRRSLTVVRYEGADILFNDSHNFLVEVLTTTGVLGFAAFLAWLILAGRRVRGPLVGFAAIAAVTMLFEPMNVGLTPLVLLAFGLAGADARSGARDGPGWLHSRGVVLTSVALAVVGAVAGGVLMRSDFVYLRAVGGSSLSELESAARGFPPWPQIPGRRAQFLGEQAAEGGGRPVGQRAIAAQHGAIERDSADPHWWFSLGILEAQWGSKTRAAAAFREALRRNPWSANARYGLLRLALLRGDRREAERLRKEMCALGPVNCVPRSALSDELDPVPPRTPGPTASGS